MVRWGSVVALCALVACAMAADSSSRLPDLNPGQQAEVDEMVHNLLHWIQNLYQQKTRKARQYFGGKPEKPRPFEPASYLPPATGYPPAGSRPTPSYSEGPAPTNPPYQPSPSQPPYQPSPSQPPYQPSPSQPPFQSSPTQPPYQPSQPDQPYQPQTPTYQPFPGYPPSQPTQPPYQPSQPPTYQPSQPSGTYPSPPTVQPTYRPSQPSQPPTYQPDQPSYQPDEPSYQPSQPSYKPSQPTFPPYQPSQPSTPDIDTLPPYRPTGETESSNTVTQGTSGDDDDRHPPHIHAITVDCGKEMMTINIEFNKVYNGIIYSQDHYNEPECVYVRENSNQVKYSFTVSLNTCGTRFYSDFENEGQAYLENVLVLQNEPGIQEVWDHIRRVRCLWEGNLTKQLVSSLSVGMLNQITSNFSGDTAMARLDIQMGRGPFAREANGLVKIGEIMTLVVTVTGDPGFDIFVRECIARDSEMRHVVPLTDSNGCVLKPKLFGAFQKTRETGNTGASIIAYAFFNAFKFPDEMDLIIQCDVELCKTDCEVCPNPGSIEPRRKRRDIIHLGNRTAEPVTTIGKGLRVVFAEDLPSENNNGFCMSPSAALWGGILVLVGSLMSSLLVSYCWQRSRASKIA
ncbi:myosin tail region-interacting protein MTI1-like isoform X2 [Hyposmocoma kahamanoa]|uniref:myosin tail region-interacting protein MTI1-like isoform X2 n=1 Tax=Hyposmocoma kahamanoa TaxID=1477025 RepID=UPI000E6D5CD4|nr:myosin tail region-interacting protein MTI1-like isoform X2 [Hyposmocoma kahamanoa]